MLGIERSAARYTWSAAAVLLLLWLAYQLRVTLFVFALALLFAYLLSPLVDLLDKAIPRRGTRTLALTLAYLLFIGGVVIAGIQVGTQVAAEAGTLSTKLPEMLVKFEAPSPALPGAVNDLKTEIVSTLRYEWSNRSEEMVKSLPAAGVKFLSVLSNLIYVVIVPVLAFFFLKDGEHIRRHILETLDGGALRTVVSSVMSDIHLLLAQYMRALVLLALSTFTAYALFFAVVHLSYGILLAVVAMALEFIPMIGPLTGASIILLVTLVTGGPFWIVAAFLLLYRMFQDYILSPLLMSQGVALHPLLVLLGVFGGAEVAGVAGSFLSVPVIATARILYVRTRRSLLAPPTASTTSTTPATPDTPAEPASAVVERPHVILTP
ncbi:MAG: AI-2E family transporter [Candidatus Solibacter sp.]